MESLNDFVNVVFGGKVTVEQIISILVAVYAVVKSITEWRAKKRLINSDRTITATEEKVEALTVDNTHLKESVSLLADVIITAYLSSNTVSPDTKKELVTIGNKLKENASISLSQPITYLIEKVEQGADVDLSTIKEEIKEKTKTAEEVLNIANETAQKAIDKLTV